MSRDLITTLYVLAIFATGFGAAVAVLLWLRHIRQQRRRAITGRVRFEALHTATPLEDPDTQSRQRALNAIESSSTATRRLVVPMALMLVAFFAGLPFLDQVPATVFSLLVAAITVLIGIAARPFVENAIAGLVISSSKILNIGDTVRISGHYGTVEDITVTHTTMKIWDWRRFVIPNATMLSREFENYSLFEKHIWAHVEFWVDHEADLDLVSSLAVASPRESKYFNDVEEPKFWVMEMEKDSVRCWVAAWAKTPADAWSLTADMRTYLVRELRRAGIRTHRTVWESTNLAPRPAPPPS